MHQRAEGATLDSGSGEPRLPRDQIPEDLTCQLCDAPKAFKNASGYAGHMATCHNVFFEQAERPAWVTNAGLKEVPQDPSELPVWAKVAIVKHEMFGETYAAVAEQMGKGHATISKYVATPAGRKAVAQVREMGDVKSLVKLFMESATMHMYADWLMALEWAKQARDHKMVHTMIKDIGLQPILQEAKDRSAAPTTLILNLGTGDIETIKARSLPAELVVEADVVDEH